MLNKMGLNQVNKSDDELILQEIPFLENISNSVFQTSKNGGFLEGIAQESGSGSQHSKPHRISWADLLKRVFQIDLAQCPDCGGEVKFIAAIMKKSLIAKILEHLKLPTDPPRFKP